MSEQLHIQFPLFSPGVFREVKQEYVKQANNEKDETIEHLKHVIAGFKAGRTKRKKQCTKRKTN